MTTHGSPMAGIPPPVAFLGAFFAGLWLQRWLWARVHAASQLEIAVGAALVGLGLLIALSAIRLFIEDRTTVIPHAQPSRFVARGPYVRTRNPMYVGVIVAYVGAAIWTGAWAAVPLLALPILLLSRWVIPMEEGKLRALFGTEYEDYCRRVRRWL